MFSEKLYFKMALLHVKRQKRRSILISLMIALSLIGLLLMEGMYEGMMIQITQNSIKTGSGTISIQHKNFRQTQNIKYNIQDTKKIEYSLEKNRDIKSFVQRINQRGIISNAGYSQSANIIGIDLKAESTHANLEGFIIQGKYSFEKKAKGAIIGYRLAKKLKTSIGKKVIIMMQDINNEVVSIALKIRGIIKTNNMSIDEKGILIDINKLRLHVGLKGATDIAILLKNQDDDYKVKQIIKKELNNKTLSIYTYKELYPSLHEGEAMMQTYNTISSGFIFTVASLGIFGVVLVSVLGRLREFGIMMAIGTKFSDIVRLIFYESLIITISGYLLGAFIGGALLYYFKLYGLDLSSFSDAFAIFGMDSNIKAIIRLEYFSHSLLSVIIATICASIIPIYSLKKKNPIQSINEQT